MYPAFAFRLTINKSSGGWGAYFALKGKGVTLFKSFIKSFIK